MEMSFQQGSLTTRNLKLATISRVYIKFCANEESVSKLIFAYSLSFDLLTDHPVYILQWSM